MHDDHYSHQYQLQFRLRKIPVCSVLDESKKLAGAAGEKQTRALNAAVFQSPIARVVSRTRGMTSFKRSFCESQLFNSFYWNQHFLTEILKGSTSLDLHYLMRVVASYIGARSLMLDLETSALELGGSSFKAPEKCFFPMPCWSMGAFRGYIQSFSFKVSRLTYHQEKRKKVEILCSICGFCWNRGISERNLYWRRRGRRNKGHIHLGCKFSML